MVLKIWSHCGQYDILSLGWGRILECFCVCVCKYFWCKLFFTLHCVIDRTTICLIAYTGLHLNSLTCVRVQRPTSHTHTQHECNQTHLGVIDRNRFEPSRDPFYFTFSPSPPHFSPAPYTPHLPFSLIIPHTNTLNHHL
jgi:hypothetical protein